MNTGSYSACGLILYVSGLLAVCSCGTPGKNLPVTEGTATMTADRIQEIKLELHDFYFKPSKIYVVVDVPVRLLVSNKTIIVPHNFSLHAPETGIDIDQDVGARKTVVIEFTPTKIGEYQFFCDKDGHMKKGMVGTLAVKAQM
jgi:plastocyanin domain-containing protein